MRARASHTTNNTPSETKVREHGNVIGFITTDRSRQHPGVRWERSVRRDGRIEKLDDSFQTVEEALTAF